jgi:hypothetical protein
MPEKWTLEQRGNEIALVGPWAPGWTDPIQIRILLHPDFYAPVAYHEHMIDTDWTQEDDRIFTRNQTQRIDASGWTMTTEEKPIRKPRGAVSYRNGAWRKY